MLLWVELMTYALTGAVCLAFGIAYAVSRDIDPWSTPLPLMFMFWPVLAPTMGAWALGRVLGERMKRQREHREIEMREQERLLREAGL